MFQGSKFWTHFDFVLYHYVEYRNYLSLIPQLLNGNMFFEDERGVDERKKDFVNNLKNH